VQKFLGAADPAEIVFTRGTTESINLVAATYGRATLKAGDEIILSGMEHHSNIVPWQILCEQTGAVIRVAPFDDRGDLLLDEYEKLLSPRTKLVAMVHLSNSLGTINPVEQIIALAHRRGAVVLLDGAQWAAHGPTDVRRLDADFYAFSGHKLYGPTGIGVLYAKSALLQKMPPYQGGGDMIKSVTFEKTTYADPPQRFEAGTPHIAGAVGLGAAIDYIHAVGLDKMAAHEARLLEYATAQLSEIDGIRLIGAARRKGSVISFIARNIHPHDIGTVLDAEGIAVRTGHHCCQPVMDRFAIPATVRASLAFYNTTAEVDALAAAVRKAIQMFE
jgi:cysteine desulfurase/selenocysteine lyase